MHPLLHLAIIWAAVFFAVVAAKKTRLTPVLFFLFAGFLIYLVFDSFNIITEKQWAETFNYFTPIYLLSIITYFIAAILFINFILQVNRKFGPGNLLKLTTGKYSTPKIESRIFMLMDLKGSTHIAEKLGHKKYSELMQNCFHDLTNVVINYNASIYQYVGDEVVLCWDMKNGLKELNWIKTFFSFDKKLQSRKDYYLNNFDLLPYFKCGLDCGEVTVAEIGDIKREIAYRRSYTDFIGRQKTPESISDKEEEDILKSESGYLARQLIEPTK